MGLPVSSARVKETKQRNRKVWEDYARREVLRLWRHFDEDELKRNFSHASTPAQHLPELFKRYRLESQREQKELHYVWEHSMDPAILLHAHPENIVRGTLFVRVDSSSWLSEIVQFHSQDMLKRLQACLGAKTIQKISFKLC